MKIVIGKTANETKVYDDDGKDITRMMRVRRIRVSVEGGNDAPQVSMDVYANVEINCDNGAVDISKIEEDSIAP